MTTAADSRPPGRLERRKARTRAAILAAASDLFHERGYDETAIQQIAERADTGVGTLYGYFPSKEDILREVLREHSREAVERYRAATDDSMHAVDRICVGLAQLARYYRENRRIMAATFQVTSRAGNVDGEGGSAMFRSYVHMVETGIERGEIRPLPVETTVRTIIGSYTMAFLRIGVWRDRADDAVTEAELEAVVRAMLTA